MGKLQDFVEARKTCVIVLKDDKQNLKALYRHGQCEYGLKNYAECITDCKRVVEIDSQNREARTLLKQAQGGQKEVDKQAKGLFQNMCKALGKGPIPEPGKSKPIGGEYDDDYADDALAEDEEQAEAKGPEVAAAAGGGA